MATIKSVQLFFQEGSSDKVYNAKLVEDAGAYTVQVEWGRRGSKLSEGNKCVRVNRAAAEREFDKCVREKRSKGYEEVGAGKGPAPVAPPAGHGSGQVSGLTTVSSQPSQPKPVVSLRSSGIAYRGGTASALDRLPSSRRVHVAVE